MSRKAYSFPSPPPAGWGPSKGFQPVNAPLIVDREDYVRERTAQAKYPAAMLAELYAAGEITKEQYERLRMERK